jgi:hypothetical protein
MMGGLVMVDQQLEVAVDKLALALDRLAGTQEQLCEAIDLASEAALAHLAELEKIIAGQNEALEPTVMPLALAA